MAAKPPYTMLGSPDARGYQIIEIDVADLSLDQEGNPRIEPQQSRAETILALVRKDRSGLKRLAADIIGTGGINPGELPHVQHTGDAYIVKEGNRRLAALMLLRNPAILDGEPSLSRTYRSQWADLSASAHRAGIAFKVRAVLGKNHEEWMRRRHLGKQKGAGLVPWDSEAKNRFESGLRPAAAEARAVIAALVSHDEKRFGPLQKTNHGFTNWERVITNRDARERVGVSVVGDRVEFRDGDRTLAMLEGILKDLQGPVRGRELNSRVANTAEGIQGYLERLEGRVKPPKASKPLAFERASDGGTKSVDPSDRRHPPRPAKPQPMAGWTRPGDERLRVLHKEIIEHRNRKLRDSTAILLRVYVDIAVRSYLERHPDAMPARTEGPPEVVTKFEVAVREAGIRIPKPIATRLRAMGKGPSLAEQLTAVLEHSLAANPLAPGRGEVIRRSLEGRAVLKFLQDAVHELAARPTLDEIDDRFRVLIPVFNCLLD